MRTFVLPSAVLVVIALTVGLAACDTGVDPSSASSTGASTTAPPQPSSSPSVPAPAVPPALAELTLSPDGLGPLRLGSPVPDVPAASAVVVWNGTKCGRGGAWLANYPAGPIGPGGDPTGAPFFFAVAHKIDSLSYINISSTQIKTSAGISIGSSVARLKTAYPEFDRVVAAPTTTLYELNGSHGTLVMEVGTKGKVPASEANRVVLMEIEQLGAESGSLFGNDAGGGICPGAA